MLCAACGESTLDRQCGACHRDALLDGVWRLDAILGEGRGAVTYAATRVTDGQRAAIKELPRSRRADDKARELFAREARVLRELDHPQIPRHLADLTAGTGRTGAFYLVTELIDGQDLATEQHRRRYTQADVLDVIAGLLPVLAYLHALSPPVVHRDVKPRNVVRATDGRLALIDFGAVRDALDDELGGTTVAGTFGFMAPEQFQGDACPATDLYGLGALAVALLTRQDPARLLDYRGALQWRPHANVTRGMTELIDALLAADPLDRPVDADEVGRLVDAVRGNPHLPLPPWRRSRIHAAPPTVDLPAPLTPAPPARRRFEPDGPFGLPLTVVDRARMIVVGGTWTVVASFLSLLAYDALRPAIPYPPPIVAEAAPIPEDFLVPPDPAEVLPD